MQNTVTTYDNQWIDLSIFSLRTSQRFYKFYSSKFDSYSILFGSDVDMFNGLYSFSVVQDSILNEIDYNIYSLD